MHLYVGDGKGKTTAAVGLAVRMAGSGGRVLFGQFLKDGSSNEIKGLHEISNIELLLPKQFFGFTFRMDAQTKEQAKEYYREYFRELREKAGRNYYQMVIMDEAVDACNAGLLPESGLLAFIKESGQAQEIVLTGRNPSKAMEHAADYYTEMTKIRHPYDNGIKARIGIEK